VLKCRYLPAHLAYDEAAALLSFANLLEAMPDMTFESYTRALSAERIRYLQEKFPQHRFRSNAEWAQAIRNHITSVLLPALERLGEPPDEILLMQSAATLSQDLFKHELALDERLDATIDRAIKRLIQTKA